MPVVNGFPTIEAKAHYEQRRVVIGGYRGTDRMGCPNCYPTEAWGWMREPRRPVERFEGSNLRGPRLL